MCEIGEPNVGWNLKVFKENHLLQAADLSVTDVLFSNLVVSVIFSKLLTAAFSFIFFCLVNGKSGKQN